MYLPVFGWAVLLCCFDVLCLEDWTKKRQLRGVVYVLWWHTNVRVFIWIYSLVLRMLLSRCCFTSTETVRLIRDGSPRRPPRLSHSSWARTRFVQCCFTSTETTRTIRDGSPGRPPRLSHSSRALTLFLLLLLIAFIQRYSPLSTDSPHSHVILHDVSARSVYTIQPCAMSLHAKPHT